MSKYLITTSLLNSYEYYINSEYKTPEENRADFLKTLSRKKFEPTEDMQKGREFEDMIEFYCTFGWFKGGINISKKEWKALEASYTDPFLGLQLHTTLREVCWKGKLCNPQEDPKFKVDFVVKEIGDIVKGGIWQATCKKDLQIGNQQFLLYGRCDVIKADTIYDIKYTGNYEAGKFLSSAQHLIYLYCLDLPKFSYLVSDGKEMWIEDYHNHGEIENEIKSKISDFISYLESDDEARGLFYSKWSSK